MTLRINVCYVTTYKLAEVRADLVSSKNGAKIVSLEVFEKTNSLLPLSSGTMPKILPIDDVVISIVVAFGSPGIGDPSVKVVIDDSRSSDVLASKRYENLDLEQNGPQRTLQIKVPNAACKSLRITVFSDMSEMFLEGTNRSVLMTPFCSN